MVTFPLHTVTFPWYSVLFMGSAYSQQQVFFKNFYLLGALFRLLQVLRMQVSRPVRCLRSDSLQREPIICSGTQHNYFTELLPATFSFSISPTTANSDEPIAFEEHNCWWFENPGKRR